MIAAFPPDTMLWRVAAVVIGFGLLWAEIQAISRDRNKHEKEMKKLNRQNQTQFKATMDGFADVVTWFEKIDRAVATLSSEKEQDAVLIADGVPPDDPKRQASAARIARAITEVTTTTTAAPPFLRGQSSSWDDAGHENMNRQRANVAATVVAGDASKKGEEIDH